MERARLAAEARAMWEGSRAEDARAERETGPLDSLAIQAGEYRRHWVATLSRSHGSFDDATRIPPMRFTDEPAPPRTAGLFETLQVFSVRVAGRTEAGAGAGGALRWPLDVFGLVAVRDGVDYNRNFRRARDECQTLTEEDPYLELTGPTPPAPCSWTAWSSRPR
ncbi:hypothetical protein C2845_PM06G03080 [Panicum miliaceum]|uniref:DUF6598 domain-containing protein n=1 Tax=Panicum miliaceum TaxID=4540 RepID=A0A3L6RGF2_PANMI|nr:hypothetical protein C2845_PM06G03080 [Panicum miliaceum]